MIFQSGCSISVQSQGPRTFSGGRCPQSPKKRAGASAPPAPKLDLRMPWSDEQNDQNAGFFQVVIPVILR